jgi:hypothetical protein
MQLHHPLAPPADRAPDSMRAIVAVTIAAVALLVVPGMFDRYVLPKQALLHVCAFLSLLVWLMTQRSIGFRPALLAGAGCMIVGLTIATARARIMPAAMTGAAVWIDWAGILIVLCRVVVDRRGRDALSALIVGLSAFEALLCILQLALPVLTHAGPLKRLDACGTFGNPEMLAGFLGMGLILVLYDKGILRPLLRWISIAIILAGVIACRSRGSWLALALTIGSIATLQGLKIQRRKRAIISAAICAGLVLLGFVAAHLGLLPPALVSLHTFQRPDHDLVSRHQPGVGFPWIGNRHGAGAVSFFPGALRSVRLRTLCRAA